MAKSPSGDQARASSQDGKRDTSTGLNMSQKNVWIIQPAHNGNTYALQSKDDRHSIRGSLVCIYYFAVEGKLICRLELADMRHVARARFTITRRMAVYDEIDEMEA